MTAAAGPTLAVLGGSGLYRLGGLEPVAEHRVDTPFGAPSDVVFEARHAACRVLFLARHGRSHQLAAHEVNYRANVYALKALGAEGLLGVSAVGSLREGARPGDVVVVDQYVDRTLQRARTFFTGLGVVAHVGFADPTDGPLGRAAAAAARSAGAVVHEGGTYVCIEGPQFSTRAESRAHRELGADVVGMTNLPEARLAREAELAYASLCFVTDYDCWHETEAPVEVSRVLAQVGANAELARRTLAALFGRLPDLGASAAATALDAALLTPPAAITAEARAALGPLLRRVLAARGAAP